MNAPVPRRAVIEMAPYVPPTGGRFGKLRLDFNENTVGCSPRVIEFLIAQLSAERLSVYPDYAEVKPKLARHFGVDPDQMLLTNGTDEAIQVFLNTYADPSGPVLLLKPSYAMYRFYAELAGVPIREAHYQPPALAFPIKELLDQLTPETRAVIISNPNNPTGVGVDLATIERILQRAPAAAILIDEAYFEFSGVTAMRLLDRYPNLFISRTFSKAYGMAALRIGALFSQKQNIAYLHKAQSPYSVNMLAAMAAAAAIEDTAFIDELVREVLSARERLYVALTRLGIGYVTSAANFVLIFAGDRAKPICAALREHAILVRDRSYEIPGAVRITVGNRAQTERMIKELEQIW
jgi:histidinol-phosphate aminotransferase